jgi:hypothetical protein
VSEAVTGAGGEEGPALSAQIERLQREVEQLQKDLQAERNKGFWRRVFGSPSAEPVEGIRERIRGRIAMALIVTLILVVMATLGYLVWLSFDLAQVGTEDLNTVIPMIGTTLLTPLVGLIGAVTGFYYGGQQALQAASEASEAAQKTQATSQDAQMGVAQAVAETVTPVATEAVRRAATNVVPQAEGQETPESENR